MSDNRWSWQKDRKFRRESHRYIPKNTPYIFVLSDFTLWAIVYYRKSIKNSKLTNKIRASLSQYRHHINVYHNSMSPTPRPKYVSRNSPIGVFFFFFFCEPPSGLVWGVIFFWCDQHATFRREFHYLIYLNGFRTTSFIKIFKANMLEY